MPIAPVATPCQLCGFRPATDCMPVYTPGNADVHLESVCADCFAVVYVPDVQFAVVVWNGQRWNPLTVISRQWFDEYAVLVAALRFMDLRN